VADAARAAVVVGNHQGERVLPDCLESLAGQDPRPARVVVADGGSTDAGPALAEAAGAHVLRLPNRGLGFLYNRGAEAVAEEHVLLLNNDVALEPGCLAALVAALDADATRFCADARQLDWDGSRTIHARTTLTRGRLLREHLPGLHLDDNVPAGDVAPTVTANGAAMLVRRSMLHDLGGFDETFFMEWEDLDLCWRAWLRGWSTVYVPDAVARHRVGAVTTAGVAPRRQASSHHNLLRFALKCLPAREAAVVVAGELVRWPRHRAAVGRGLARAARELPEIVRLRRRIAPRRDLLRWMLGGQPE
jgi:GT2 family glycosyltransferase